MKARRSILALGAFFVLAAAVAGCGSGEPGNSVADVAGNPITTQAFNHWMYVAAKSQAAQSPGSPVIVANDPPKFTKCVAQVRKQVPSLTAEFRGYLGVPSDLSQCIAGEVAPQHNPRLPSHPRDQDAGVLEAVFPVEFVLGVFS